jgi:hypothetical protein
VKTYSASRLAIVVCPKSVAFPTEIEYKRINARLLIMKPTRIFTGNKKHNIKTNI